MITGTTSTVIASTWEYVFLQDRDYFAVNIGQLCENIISGTCISANKNHFRERKKENALCGKLTFLVSFFPLFPGKGSLPPIASKAVQLCTAARLLIE